MGYKEGSIYYYAPNKVAPIFFAIMFTLSGMVHFYQTMYYYYYTFHLNSSKANDK